MISTPGFQGKIVRRPRHHLSGLFRPASLSRSAISFSSLRNFSPLSPPRGPTSSRFSLLNWSRMRFLAFGLASRFRACRLFIFCRNFPAQTPRTRIGLKHRPIKNPGIQFSPWKCEETHVRDDRAPSGRRTHGEMDRFRQEVSDEAHMRTLMHWEVHLTSHPRPLFREGAGKENEGQMRCSPGQLCFV